MYTERSPHYDTLPTNSRPPPKPMERLPQLNYSLLKDGALRKKLSEIGISNTGPRALLIRRHTEWINLVNSNCDSTKPRTKRELLHELDVWDKTQGRQVLNSLSGGYKAASVMSKEFDGAAWATNHDQDFQSLIAKARTKLKQEDEKAPSDKKPDINHRMPISEGSAQNMRDGTRSPTSPTNEARLSGDEWMSPEQTPVIEVDTDS